jgi:hypothetical protein
VRVWWLDACEPELVPESTGNLRYHLGSGLEVGNIYPLLNAKAFHDGMTAEGEDEVVSLCRSAWAGSRRAVAVVPRAARALVPVRGVLSPVPPARLYYLPSKTAVIDQYLKGGPEYTVFARETESSRSRTAQYGANYPKVSQAIWTAIQSAITGTASVSSALQTAQGTISGISPSASS